MQYRFDLLVAQPELQFLRDEPQSARIVAEVQTREIRIGRIVWFISICRVGEIDVGSVKHALLHLTPDQDPFTANEAARLQARRQMLFQARPLVGEWDRVLLSGKFRDEAHIAGRAIYGLDDGLDRTPESLDLLAGDPDDRLPVVPVDTPHILAHGLLGCVDPPCVGIPARLRADLLELRGRAGGQELVSEAVHLRDELGELVSSRGLPCLRQGPPRREGDQPALADLTLDRPNECGRKASRVRTLRRAPSPAKLSPPPGFAVPSPAVSWTAAQCSEPPRSRMSRSSATVGWMLIASSRFDVAAGRRPDRLALPTARTMRDPRSVPPRALPVTRRWSSGACPPAVAPRLETAVPSQRSACG